MNMVEKLIGVADAAIQPLINDWYSEVIEDERAFARAAVEAVLTALSEPTDNMLEAGADNVVGCCLVSLKDAREIWQAMLAAASKEN